MSVATMTRRTIASPQKERVFVGLDEPLGYPDGLNAYTVELNSPAGGVDPMGLAEDSVTLDLDPDGRAAVAGMPWYTTKDTEQIGFTGATKEEVKVVVKPVDNCYRLHGEVSLHLRIYLNLNALRAYVDGQNRINPNQPVTRTDKLLGSYGHEQRHVLNSIGYANYVADWLRWQIDRYGDIKEEPVAKSTAQALAQEAKTILDRLLEKEGAHAYEIPADGEDYPPIGTMPERPAGAGA